MKPIYWDEKVIEDYHKWIITAPENFDTGNKYD